MRAFCLFAPPEPDERIRFALLRQRGDILQDGAKRYLVVAPAYPTNWKGKLREAYLIQPHTPQVFPVGGRDVEVHGRTVELTQAPLVRDALAKEVSETVYERTLSAQVRRMGNRRLHRGHAVLLIALGFTISMLLLGAIHLAKTNTPATPTSPPVVVNTTGSGAPQSGPAPTPTQPEPRGPIVVQTQGEAP